MNEPSLSRLIFGLDKPRLRRPFEGSIQLALAAKHMEIPPDEIKLDATEPYAAIDWSTFPVPDEAADLEELRKAVSFLKPDAPPEMHCHQCGGLMQVDGDGVSHHITGGKIDHDKDADHVPYKEKAGTTTYLKRSALS